MSDTSSSTSWRTRDEGEGSFFVRLETQLARAPGTAKQLAAEMFWVMYLFPVPSSMQPGTKRQQIRQVWEWSGEPLPDAPFELNEALNDGIGSSWAGLPRPQVAGIPLFHSSDGDVDAVFGIAMPAVALRTPGLLQAGWKSRTRREPGNCGTFCCICCSPTTSSPWSRAPTRESSCVRSRRNSGEDPNAFDYKDRIALDRQILVIRKELQEKGAASDFGFYDEPYLEIWRPERVGSDGTDEGWYKKRFGDARVWVLAPGRGARFWGEFQEKGIIAIGWDDLGDLRDYGGREGIHERIREAYGAANPTMDSLACYQFAYEMQPGDHIVVKRGQSEILGHGVITSEYQFHEMRSEYKNIREVRWEVIGKWSLPRGRWVAIKTLTDFSDYKPWLQFAFGLMERTEPPTDPLSDSGPTRYSRQDALEDLFLSEADFDRIIDALERKKNVVLEGPPGVGKTFTAKRVAYRVIGYQVPERVRMIQFHQSYAYEDFIQGYRPRDDGGFKLRNGVFFSFCREAAANPDDRYVFIIDEVNRGNLGKIFGELMMLIEADKRGPEYAVPLTYSPRAEPFHVPENLYLIGMMNTADRSLAMVDYALRRRFAFIRLPPAFATDQFSNFLNREGVPEEIVEKIVRRFSELNERIRADHRNLGPGFEIGHSFFCPGDDDGGLDESWYDAIIRGEIEPLLREYWFDRPDHVDGEIRALLS